MTNWKAIAEQLAEALEGVGCYIRDAKSGHLLDRDSRQPVNNSMATEDLERFNAALTLFNQAKEE